MDPTKVLNEEERKKFTHPRKRPRQSQREGSAAETIGTSSTSTILIYEPEEPEDPEEPEELTHLESNIDNDVQIEEFITEPELVEKEEEHKAIPEIDFAHRRLSAKEYMSNMVQETERIMIELYHQQEKNFCQKAIDTIIDGHLNKSSWSINHSLEIKSHLCNIKNWVELIAENLPHLSEICPEDRQMLVEKNAPLSMEYISARYFTADTGIDQIYWIFGPSDRVKLSKFAIDHINYFC